ncbi:restriction endonuclease subunit S [Microbispora amethystogenes]|uniref:Type I restriction modification DNA specificity domain-containing protein n=1 Tax=Microbispora amethystogenes TaxID=1427754 RepID=A0ABQ4FKY7_9ACTN|nr:restriction endonuclease subunit S [Microbispora amethystogenes]GIH35479.1 hypothetical protein Mam01_56430 [Microbispora amethystogenes]
MTSMKRVRVGDILQLERYPVEIEPDCAYQAIGIRSFGKGIFHYPAAPGGQLSKLRYFRFPDNALAISNIKAWEGAIGVSAASDLGAVASNRFLFYTPVVEDIEIRYLFHYFLSEKGLAQIGRASPGSADRNRTLGIKAFESIELQLPDLYEQRRMAAHLDAAGKKISSIEQLRSQMRRQQAALAESLFSSVVDADVPRPAVDELLLSRRTPVGIDPDARYRALGLRSFGKGTIRYDFVPGSELSKLRYFRFPEGALVLSNIKAWEGAIGVTAREDTECVASNRFLFYLPRDSRVNISYIRHYLLTRTGLADIGVCSPGMADRNRTLGIKAFERLRVPIPDRSVQDRIARLLDGLAQGMRTAAQTDGHVAALRTSLLNAAFTDRL